jgi:hypothetical protein
MDWIGNPESWIALVTLTALEIVLGIDNIIFISILTGKLPRHQQAKARTLGLGAAMFTRIALLLTHLADEADRSLVFRVEFGDFGPGSDSDCGRTVSHS